MHHLPPKCSSNFLDYEFKKDSVTTSFTYFFVHGIVLNKTKELENRFLSKVASYLSYLGINVHIAYLFIYKRIRKIFPIFPFPRTILKILKSPQNS